GARGSGRDRPPLSSAADGRHPPSIGAGRPFVGCTVAGGPAMRWDEGMSPSRAVLERRFKRVARSVLLIVLWAIPFALFFGTLYGGGASSYAWAYVVSLVFATVIRSAVALAEVLVVPALRRRAGNEAQYPWVL